MFEPHRSLTDFLLVRARVEPGHEHPLRVLIHRRGMDRADVGTEQGFADADSAAACVRSWLNGVVRRWEGGERSLPPPQERERGSAVDVADADGEE